MSSWIMHLRVAEQVNKSIDMLPQPYFVGSIAPDSGRKVDSFTYDPPKNISHCYDRVNDRLKCNDLFFDTYAKNEKDQFKKAFYVGYYVHVLTDTYFVRNIVEPLIMSKGRDFWRSNVEQFRRSWNELDVRFLAKTKAFDPLRLLGKTEVFPDLLDFFQKGDIISRVRSVCALYKDSVPDTSAKLIGIDEVSAEEFVRYASAEITKRLTKML